MDTTIHDNGITQFIMCTPPFCRGGGGGGGYQIFKNGGDLTWLQFSQGLAGKDGMTSEFSYFYKIGWSWV